MEISEAYDIYKGEDIFIEEGTNEKRNNPSIQMSKPHFWCYKNNATLTLTAISNYTLYSYS